VNEGTNRLHLLAPKEIEDEDDDEDEND